MFDSLTCGIFWQLESRVNICRTDAAVGPDGVVVLLRHTGVAGEAVVRSHWFLYL